MKKRDHHLVQGVLDGDMSREEFEALQNRMRGEPELINLYQNYSLLHHTLSEEYEGGFPVSPEAADSGRRVFGPRILMAAAAVALLAAGWWLRPLFEGEAGVVAAATFSLDAVWRFEGPTRNLGGATGVPKGARLHLEQGRAAISLEPSISAVVEGPSEISFSAPGTLHLEKGRGWFRSGGSGGPLRISTPRLSLADEGTEFAIETSSAGPDELRVLEGRVKAAGRMGGAAEWISAGEVVMIGDDGSVSRTGSTDVPYPKCLGRFRSILAGNVEKSAWRVDYGAPVFDSGRVEGANFSAYHQLVSPEPSAENGVLLVTIDAGVPQGGAFHTDGWAGMSFFSGNEEVLFFGDSFGNKSTWSLDVKQRIPVILPEQPVEGPRSVTLRYEVRTGDVSLHEGGVPLRPAFCRGRLPAGTRFDRLRIGASAGAALFVKSLRVRSGG